MLYIAVCFEIPGVPWDEMDHTHSSTPSVHQGHSRALCPYCSQRFEAQHCNCRGAYQRLGFYIQREIVLSTLDTQY